MSQWVWNYQTHNSKHAKKPMDSSATCQHLSQPLANPPMCIAVLYTKSAASIESNCFLQLCKTTMTPLPTQITPDVWILITPPSAPLDTISLICPEKSMTTIPVRQSLHILKLPTACSATSSHFYLPPRYESPVLNINVSLDMPNLQTVNIITLHFHVWQHMGKNHNETQLQHLADIPSVPVHKVYEHLLNSSLHMTPFNMELSGDTNTLWNMFTHPAVYISALGPFIILGIGWFCCYFFWCQPARSACQPLKSGIMLYTIVDDNVEEAPIYRCEGKAPKPTRPCENHGLAIEHLPTWLEMSSEATVEVICSPCPRIIGKIFQNPGDTGMHVTSVSRLRLDTTYSSTDWNEQIRRKQNNS